MTDSEIDKRLALAIGYPTDRVRILKTKFGGFVQVSNNDDSRMDGPMHFNGWQRFDHTDPAVIWPIAESFDAFPEKRYSYDCIHIGWHCFASGKSYGAHPNPATATAMAVIKYCESAAIRQGGAG